MYTQNIPLPGVYLIRRVETPTYSGKIELIWCFAAFNLPSTWLSIETFSFDLVGGFLFSSSFDKTIHVWSLQVQTLKAQVLILRVLLLVKMFREYK